MSGSNFEEYDNKAYSYSVNRYPVGVEAILSGLKRVKNHWLNNTYSMPDVEQEITLNLSLHS